MSDIETRIHNPRRNYFEHVFFEGTTPGQEVAIANDLNALDFAIAPKTIRKIIIEDDINSPDTLGTWWHGKGEYTLKKALIKYPQSIDGTVTHEATHAASPIRAENIDLYRKAGRSENEINSVYNEIRSAAMQTLATKRYLNGYHAWLARELAEGRLTEERFIEETSAILMEERVTNPKHLEQVNDAQRIQYIKKNGNILGYIDLFDVSNTQIIYMVESVNNASKDLETYLSELRLTLKENIELLDLGV